MQQQLQRFASNTSNTSSNMQANNYKSTNMYAGSNNMQMATQNSNFPSNQQSTMQNLLNNTLP